MDTSAAPARTLRRHAGRAVLLGALVALTAACGPLPPVTPRPAEIGGLRARVARSFADSESVMRLAGGLWAEGDQEGALSLVERARVAVPEEPAYTVVLGAMREAQGDYMGARADYLDFLRGVSSPLSGLVADRLDAMRGRTATPLARGLVEGGTQLDYSPAGYPVIAMPRLRAPDGDAELGRLALAATEVLFRDLRAAQTRGFGVRGGGVIDWELAEATRVAMDEGPGAQVGPGISGFLGAGGVVLGELDRISADSIIFRFQVIRLGQSIAVQYDSMRTTPAGFAEAHMLVSLRVWEMFLGAGDEAVAEDYLPPAPIGPVDALLALGDGLLELLAGNELGAQRHFERGAILSPSDPALAERLAGVESFLAFVNASELPFGEEALDLARRAASVSAQLATHGAALGLSPSERSGVGEVFGLDRLGAQVFVDFVISSGGMQR